MNRWKKEKTARKMVDFNPLSIITLHINSSLKAESVILNLKQEKTICFLQETYCRYKDKG